MLPVADGGRPRGTFPYVNVVLLSLNALVFCYEIALGGLGFLFGGHSLDLFVFFLKFGFIPAELSTGQAFQTLAYGLEGGAPSVSIASPLPTWGTILSSMFIHGGLMHFVGNMLFLWVFGDNIEDTFGHTKYLVFYLGAGFLAALAHFAVDPGSQTPMVGASGAISGVMGAYLVLYPQNRIRTLIIYIFITVIDLRAVWLLVIWFALQTIQGLLSIGISEQVSTAFFAHIGGFVIGMIIGALWRLIMWRPSAPSGPYYGGDRSSGPQYWRGRRID